MRIISQLAKKDKRDDTFGMKDEDWDMYTRPYKGYIILNVLLLLFKLLLLVHRMGAILTARKRLSNLLS
jgi:hypothetical protein